MKELNKLQDKVVDLNSKCLRDKECLDCSERQECNKLCGSLTPEDMLNSIHSVTKALDRMK